VKRCLACEATWRSEGWSCPRCSFEPSERNGFLAFAPELEEDTSSYDPGLSRLLATLEPRSFWFRSRNRLLLQTMRRHFRPAGSILEIGCGTGFVLSALADANPALRVAGGELLSSGLEPARERLPQADLFQLDARRLPWREEWDVLGAFDVLEHIDEDEAVLAEMARAAVPGGGLMVTVPQHSWLWSASDDQAHHKRRYSRAELVGKVERAGFAVRRVTSFVSSLLPVMAASRLVRRGGGEEADLEAELCPARPLSALFEWSLRGELALIRRGVSLPAGGSLLVVAERRG
jgi:SAM-dependent methyltransferase